MPSGKKKPEEPDKLGCRVIPISLMGRYWAEIDAEAKKNGPPDHAATVVARIVENHFRLNVGIPPIKED
jgi:hypothetical protein